MKERVDRKPRPKKYATINALIDKNSEWAEENGYGRSKTEVVERFCSG